MKALFVTIKAFIIIVVLENIILSFLTGHETYNHLSPDMKQGFFQLYVLIIMFECVLYTILFTRYSLPSNFDRDHKGTEILPQDFTWTSLAAEVLKVWKVLESEGDGHYRLTKKGSIESEYGAVNNSDINGDNNIELNVTIENPTISR